MVGMQAAVVDLFTSLENGAEPQSPRRARRARRWRSSKASSNRRRTATIASISASPMHVARAGTHLRRRNRSSRSAIVRLYVARRLERWIVPLLISRCSGQGHSRRATAHHGQRQRPGLGGRSSGFDAHSGRHGRRHVCRVSRRAEPGVLTGSFVWVDRSIPPFVRPSGNCRRAGNAQPDRDLD